MERQSKGYITIGFENVNGFRPKNLLTENLIIAEDAAIIGTMETTANSLPFIIENNICYILDNKAS